MFVSVNVAFSLGRRSRLQYTWSELYSCGVFLEICISIVIELTTATVPLTLRNMHCEGCNPAI